MVAAAYDEADRTSIDQSGVLPTRNASYGFQHFRDYISTRLKGNLNQETIYDLGDQGITSRQKRGLEGWTTIDVGPTE